MQNGWIAYNFTLPVFDREKWNPQNISKSIQIYGTNSNCCELFYRLNRAISKKEKSPINESSSNDFIRQLNTLYSASDKDLYNQIVVNDGTISGYLGEKDRILKEISLGKHITLQNEYSEDIQTNKIELFPADIVEAEINKKISQTKINQIKSFFYKIINKIQGKGER